jgi:hypothetical protein
VSRITHNRAASARWSIRIVALALLVPLASGCDPETFAAATITYEQIGACNGTPTPTGAVTAGAGAAYIAYKIYSIENTMANARDFEFDPNRLYINEDPIAHVNTTYADSMGNPFGTHGTTVRAGTTAQINGVVFAIVQSPSINGDTVGRYNLLHETPAGAQGAFVVSKDTDRVSFPYRGGCHELTY